MDRLSEVKEFRSLPELMRSIFEGARMSGREPDEWFATDLVVAWMRAHPEVVRALLVDDPADLLQGEAE